MAKSHSLAPMEDEKTKNSLFNQRTFRLNTLNFEKQRVAFYQSARRQWPRTKYLQFGDERFPANVGTINTQATRHERRKKCCVHSILWFILRILLYFEIFVIYYSRRFWKRFVFSQRA